MTTLIEGKHAGEFLVSEANVGSTGVSRSRDKGVLAVGQNLDVGAILGVVAASGEYAVHDPLAVDGTEVVAGILFDAADATTVAQPIVVIARDAEVHKGEITYGTAVPAEMDAIDVGLIALGIIPREHV